MSEKRPIDDNEDELNERKSMKNDEQETNQNENNEEENNLMSNKKSKNKRKLEFEEIYLKQLPCSESYEKSYMHKENISHVISATRTDFIITGK